MARVFGIVIFIIYVLVGLYLINYPFNFITMPTFIVSIEKWILFIGGILIIIGGVKYLFARRHEGIQI